MTRPRAPASRFSLTQGGAEVFARTDCRDFATWTAWSRAVRAKVRPESPEMTPAQRFKVRPSAAALAVLLAATSAGCNALAENPGRNPSTEPRPQIALDCETVASGSGTIGAPVESGLPRTVARGFLSRHGLRRGDRLLLERGPWEPTLAAVRVVRATRTVGSVELERAEGGWIMSAFALCDDFDDR